MLTIGTVVSVVVVTRAVRSALTRGRSSPPGRVCTPRRLWLLAAGLRTLAVALAALALAMFAVGPLLGHVRDLAPGADKAVALGHRA